MSCLFKKVQLYAIVGSIFHVLIGPGGRLLPCFSASQVIIKSLQAYGL